jgi:hypothetical protein
MVLVHEIVWVGRFCIRDCRPQQTSCKKGAFEFVFLGRKCKKTATSDRKEGSGFFGENEGFEGYGAVDERCCRGECF